MSLLDSYTDLIIRNNVIGQTDDGVTPRIDAIGVFFTESTTDIVEGGADHFTDVIVRRNIIREVNQPLTVTTGILGLQMTACTHAVVDYYNIIDNCRSPDVFYYNGVDQSLSAFNNKDSAGNILLPWNPGAARYFQAKNQLQPQADYGLLALTGRRAK